MQLDETSLAAAAKRGDRHALQLLVERHERGFYACALAVVGSSWDARDAVQDTLLDVCAKIESLRDASKFRPWATRILMNKCYDALRRRSRELPLPAVANELEEAPIFPEAESDYDLLQAVKALDSKRRLAIALRFFVGLSYQEMVDVTGWPLGSVKSRINRALEQLREALRVSQGER